MKHFYQNIPGWFDYEDLYSYMVQTAPVGSPGAKFVEVGAWKGSSACFMAVEIINSGKKIDFYAVDTWKGSVEHQEGGFCEEPLLKIENGLYDAFIENISPVKGYIKPIRMTSIEAASQFEDESLDFVFLDASHEEEDVAADRNAWLPKIKKGGVLAGHDIGWEGVKKAISTLTYRPYGNSSWFYRKPNEKPFSLPQQFYHFIAYVNCPELLRKAAESTNDVAKNGCGIVIDNRNDLTLPSAEEVLASIPNNNFKVVTPDVPLTTAQTMNYMKKLAVKADCDFFLWIHGDGEIVKGSALDLVKEAADKCSAGEKWGCIFTKYDVFCAFSVEALKQTGEWDWLRFPYYFLDNDYYTRLKDAGYPCLETGIKIEVEHHNNASNTIKSDPIRNRVNALTFPVCAQLYKEKYPANK